MALQNILLQEIVQKLGWTLLHFVWQAAAIALVLGILLAVLRKSSANVRYIVACAVLGLIVLLPIVTFQLVPVSTPQPAGKIEPGPAPVVLPAEPLEETPLSRALEYMEMGHAENVGKAPTANWKQHASELLDSSLPHIVAGWLLGVFGLSLWHLGGWAQLQRLRNKMVKKVDDSVHNRLCRLSERLQVKRAVRLLESALVQVPTVVGWLRPVILLPASALTGLTAEQLEALLAHELAHIRRYDYLVNMLQTVVETLGFYHPAVWWVSHRIRIERENCCDDLAVSISGNRVRYAKALASMEEIRSGRSNLAVAATGGSLFGRIRRLVAKDSPDGSRASWIPFVITILLIAIIAVPTTIAITTKSPEPRQETDAMGNVKPESAEWDNIGEIIPPDFNDTKVLTEHINLGSIGQDCEGKVFITCILDSAQSSVRRHRFVLVQKSGDILEPSGYTTFRPKNKLQEKFGFNAPFLTREIEGFRFQIRPLPLTGIDNSLLQLLQVNSAAREQGKPAASKLAPPGRYAIELDGVDDYLFVPDSPILRLEAPFTVEMWIKTNLPTDPNKVYWDWAVISKGFYVGIPRAWLTGFGILLHRHLPEDPSQLLIEYSTANNSGLYTQTYGTASKLKNGKSDWIHISHVFNGKHYKSAPGQPLVIGKFLIPTTSPLMGQIGEIRIWNGARTREQIRRYENVALTGNEPDLAAWWPFEQKEGQFAHDMSGNNNHARLGSSSGADDADPKWIDLKATTNQTNQKTSLPLEIEISPDVDRSSVQTVDGDTTKDQNKAWQNYLEISEALYKGANREEIAQQYLNVGKKYPNMRSGRICVELGRLLEQMAIEDKSYEPPKNIENMTQQQRINYYIYQLRDVAEREMFIPGKCRVLRYPRTPDSPAVALRKMGTVVVPAMILLLEDRRPTRSVGLSRNGGVVLRHCDIALEIIADIAGQSLPNNTTTFDPRTERGAYLSTANEKQAKEIIRRVKQWWRDNENASLGESRQGQTPAPSEPKLTRSAAPSDVNKSIVKVDLSVVEVPPGSRVNRETTARIKNILGGKITIPDSPAAADLLRKAAGATAPVKVDSAGDKRLTQEEFKTLFDLLVSRGYVKILMNPALQVVEGQTARLKTDQSSIEVTANAVEDDIVYLTVKADHSSQFAPSIEGKKPMISRRSFASMVRINSGQIQIIGGLIQKVPPPDTDSNVKVSQTPNGELMCIVTASITTPTADARPKEQVAADKNQVVQKFYKLKYYSASDAAQIVRPLLGKTGYVSADQKTNALLIIDTVENLKRIEKIITVLDVPQTAPPGDAKQQDKATVDKEYEVIQLSHINANEAAKRITKAFSQLPKKEFRPSILVQPIENTGQIIIFGKPDIREKIKKLLAEIDAPTPPSGKPVTRVYDISVLVYIGARISRGMVDVMMDRSGLGAGDRENIPDQAIVNEAQNIVNLIMQTIDPNSWFQNNLYAIGIITPFPAARPRKLAIYQTLPVHQQIVKLLALRREQINKTQISIELRFLYTNVKFLDEVRDSMGIGFTSDTFLDDKQLETLLRASQKKRYIRSSMASGATVLNNETARFNAARHNFMSFLDYSEPNNLSQQSPTVPVDTFCSITPRIEDNKNIIIDFIQDIPGLWERVIHDRRGMMQSYADTIAITNKRIPNNKTFTFACDIIKFDQDNQTALPAGKKILIVLIKPTIIVQEERPRREATRSLTLPRIDPNDPLIKKLEEQFKRYDDTKKDKNQTKNRPKA